jgi:hypothetical protein
MLLIFANVKLWISVVMRLPIGVETMLTGPLAILYFQKERVEKKEITASTLRNYFKTIKMFCEVTDIIKETVRSYTYQTFPTLAIQNMNF